jgi:hypothetical protein
MRPVLTKPVCYRDSALGRQWVPARVFIAINVWVGFPKEAPPIPIQINLTLYRVLKFCLT